MQNWYKDWFESPNYLHVYNHRDDTDAQKLSDLILSITNLPPSSKILDAILTPPIPLNQRLPQSHSS